MWTHSRRDRPRELPKVSETARIPRWCAGIAKRKATECQSAARDRKLSARENRMVRRKAMAKVPQEAIKGSKANASSVASQGTCRKIAGPKRRMCSSWTRRSLYRRMYASTWRASSSMRWTSGQYMCQKETASIALESTRVQH